MTHGPYFCADQFRLYVTKPLSLELKAAFTAAPNWPHNVTTQATSTTQCKEPPKNLAYILIPLLEGKKNHLEEEANKYF